MISNTVKEQTIASFTGLSLACVLVDAKHPRTYTLIFDNGFGLEFSNKCNLIDPADMQRILDEKCEKLKGPWTEYENMTKALKVIRETKTDRGAVDDGASN